MAVPLTLSSVPSQTPYIQYVATASQTVFPYPFEITQDSDLIVLLNGVQQATDSGYTLSGQGTTGGGNVTFTTGLTAGTIVTIYRNIAISRVSQLTQNGTFFSSTFNNEFNKIYLIMQQLQQANGFALQIPNTNNPAGTTVLTPANYANKYLAFDSNGNPTPALLTTSGSLTGPIIVSLLTANEVGNFIYPKTAAELAAGVTPTAYQYAPGNVFRYGALGNNVANDVSAFNQAVSVASVAGGSVYVPGGFTYALSTNVNVAASNVRIYGDGLGSILNFTGTSRLGGLSFVGTQGAHITGCMVENLQVVGAGTGVSTGTGVFGHYCDNFKILSVTAYNWSDNAFGCGDSANPDGSNNIQISNCVGYNVSQGISCFYPSRNVIITGNTFYNITLYDGIDVEGTNGGTSGTATSGSTTTIVDTTKTWAVNQWQGLAGTVTISGTLYPIYVESNTATTLTIAPLAVSVVASDAYQVFDNSFTVIANNVVYNMTGSGSAGPTHGINVELTPYASITGNVVYQATNGSGIHLFGSPYSTVSGNTCFSNGQPGGGTYSSGFGIYIGANCGNCTVVGNTTNGNAFGSCKLTDDATAASYNVLINDNNFNEGVIVQSGNVSLVSPYGATIKNKGTFTPTVTGISGGTYSIQTGEYTLIDNLVTFTLNVGYSGATSTGSIGISGLPFTSTASNVTAMIVRPNGLPITTGSQLVASVNQSATTVAISQWLESSGALSAVTAPTSLAQLTISGTYPTS